MTLLRFSTVTTLGFAALLSVGCAPPQATPQRSAIINGTTDTADPGVVIVSVQLDDGFFANCTVEVIAPHVLLTAAHCVDPEIVGPIKTLSVFVGPDAFDQAALADVANWPRVVDVQLNPQFDASARAHDNALLLLAKPVKITPLPIYRGPITDAMIGQPLRLVGYGATDPNDAETWGVRTETTVALSGFDERTIWYDDTEHSGCDGDSGGAGLMKFGEREALVATISGSRSATGACDQGGVLDPVALDLEAFILPHIATLDPDYTVDFVTAATAAPDLGDVDPPAHDAGCNTGGPISPALPLLGVGVTLWVINRRESRRNFGAPRKK